MEEIIRKELEQIEQTMHVRILYATESGSRSWGFASPDSDYDVRFVYVRPTEDYLKVRELSDVIEWKLDEVLDINGWDLKKGLRLCASGNQTLFEWGNSPIVYFQRPEWSEIMQVCRNYFSVRSSVSHYVGLATTTWFKHLTGETVKYKKYFYALRPLLSAVYIEQTHEPPPMLFSELMKMDMPPALRKAIEKLIEVKKVTMEGDENPHIPEVRDYIRDELERQKAILGTIRDDRNPNWDRMDDCFLKILRENA